MKKRILSILLALCMLASLLVNVALAADTKQFTDIEEGTWYYDYVDNVVKKGYFVGKSDTEFKPFEDMNRAMFAVVLAKIEGVELDNSKATKFPDVPAGLWYTGAVAWAADLGLLAGYPDGNYYPAAQITRQEMCAIMERYLDYRADKYGEIYVVENPAPATFIDMDKVNDYAKSAVEFCWRYGLIAGFPTKEMLPQGTSNRAQVAAVVWRLALLIDNAGHESYVPPVDPSKAYTITYNLNYDGCGDPVVGYTESNTASEKSFDILTDVTRTDFVLMHWNTKADGTGMTYVLDPAEPYTAEGDLTLYAIWGHSITYKPENGKDPYVVNIVADTEGKTEFITEDPEKNTYFAKADHTLSKWLGDDGNAYDVGATYKTDKNLVLTAQWIANDDYIGKGVAAVMDKINTYVNEKTNNDYINDKLDRFVDPYVDIDEIAYNGEITKYNGADARVQTVGAQVAITDDVVVKLIDKSAEYAVALLGEEMSIEDLRDLILDLYHDFEDATGVDITREDVDGENLKADATEVAKDIYDRLYEEFFVRGKNLWANFHDGNGNYYTGDVTVTVGGVPYTFIVDEVNKSVNLSGNKKATARAMAGAIAREMYAELKTCTDWTSEVELTSTIVVEFSGSSTHEAATDKYPYTYPVNLTLNLDSGEMVQYKFDGKSFVKLYISSDIQNAYETNLDEALRAAQANKTLIDGLHKVANRVIDNNATIKALLDQLAAYNVDVDALKTEIKEKVIPQWIVDNLYAAAKQETVAMADSAMIPYDFFWTNNGQIVKDGDKYAAMIGEKEVTLGVNDAIYDLVEKLCYELADYVIKEVGETKISGMTVDTLHTDIIAKARQAAKDNAGAGWDSLTEQEQDDWTFLSLKMAINGGDYDAINEDIRNYLVDLCGQVLKQVDPDTGELYSGYTINVLKYKLITAVVNGEIDANVTIPAAAKDVLVDACFDKLIGYNTPAPEYAPAEVEKLVDQLILETLDNYDQYIEQISNFKDLKTLSEVQLGNLSTLMRNKYLHQLLEKHPGTSVMPYLARAIRALPAAASVEIDGLVISEAELKEIQEAKDLSEAVYALADFIAPLSDLSISDFAGDGIPVTVKYNNRTFTFNFVIELQ